MAIEASVPTSTYAACLPACSPPMVESMEQMSNGTRARMLSHSSRQYRVCHVWWSSRS